MLRKFYGDILPSGGHYCLTLLPQGRHVWVESLDELVELTESHAERTGVYFGTAAFATSANRTQANVLSLQALRLDIDAGPEKLDKHGPEKVYATQRDAVAACAAFFKATTLIPTYLVSSGAGLHIYYCLDEPLAPAEWLRLAKGLSRLGAKFGLKIDPSVTEDSARILRPLGALHNNGKRVQIIKHTGVLHSAEELANVLPVEAPVSRKYDTSINDDLDLSFQGPPSSAIKVAEHCGALREVAESGGNVPEPHWRAMIGLVKRTVEGIDVAQLWSAGYSGYNPAEVERKFNNWSTGPTTCTEFAKHSDACKTCKFQGKVKSPINLGLMTAPEIEQLPEEVKPAPPAPPAPTGDPWDGKIPAGFDVVRDKTGRLALVYALQTEKETDTGEVVPVVIHVPFTHDVFWFGQWAEADHSDDTAQVTLHLWTGGRIKNYLLDQSVVASQAKLLEYLSGKAIQTTTHKRAAQAMQDYAKAGLQRIKGIGHRPKVNDHLGLRILDDGALVSAHGKYVIYPDGEIQEAMLGAGLRSVADQFPLPLPPSTTGVWSPDVWAEHIVPRATKHVAFLKKYYARPGMERFQLAILLGLASPLMAFVTASFFSGSALPRMSSLSVSLFSRESARGKTTAVMSAILAYGKPGELANDSGKRGATDNGRIARLSLHGTLPNIMDEMGGATAASVADMVSAVANGAGKTRATKDGGLNESAPWSLINLITTNTSQRDMIAAIQDNSGAIQYRLLEINVEDMPEYDQALRDSFTEDWAEVNRDCPGALGAVIHREICALGVAKANKLVTECCARASAMVDANQTARFQYRGLGAMLALHLILAKLGLSPFALPGVVEEFKKAHDAGRDFVVTNTLPTDGLELLSRALQDLAPHTLITDGETHINRHTTRFDEPLNARVPDVIKARHIKSVGRTYLSVQALRDWCVEKGVSDRDIIKAADRAGILNPFVRGTTGVSYSSESYNLTKGMRANMNLRCKVYSLDVRKMFGVAPAEGEDNVVPLHPGEPEAAEESAA